MTIIWCHPSVQEESAVQLVSEMETSVLHLWRKRGTFGGSPLGASCTWVSWAQSIYCDVYHKSHLLSVMAVAVVVDKKNTYHFITPPKSEKLLKL